MIQISKNLKDCLKGSDDNHRYDLVLTRNYTVNEFVEEIITFQDMYGMIAIPNNVTKTKVTRRTLKNSKLTSPFPSWVVNKNINGGCVNYCGRFIHITLLTEEL